MDFISSINSDRPALICELNETKLSSDKAEQLLEYISGVREFACLTASGVGRTLYLSDESTIGLKLKGAGGLRLAEDGALQFYSPQPQEYFSGLVAHTSLNPDLSFQKVESKPKALNSLRADSANMEFIAQRRLFDHDIGFDGICWGQFVKDDHPEIDLNGYKTGFVISEYDPSYIPLDKVLRYRKNAIGVPEPVLHDCLSTDERDFHLDLVTRIGKLKRLMAENARLGRHSSTSANFLYNPERHDLKVTDTDTVLDYELLEGRKKGSQFLRDGVSDLLKRLSDFRFSQPSEMVTRMGEDTVISFLKGLFGDIVREEIIAKEIKKLEISKRVKAVISTSDTSSWIYFGGMYPELYEVFYRIYLESDLTDIFPIEKVDPQELRRRAREFHLENNIL